MQNNDLRQQTVDALMVSVDFLEPTKEKFGESLLNLDIPEINLEMRSEAIVAKTRKLKAVWSPEFAQDLNAYHSIDAEAELTSMLSEYVSQEIDLEILDMLIQNAQTTERWSAKIGFDFDPSTNTFVQSNATAQAYNQGTWFQTLGTKIQKVSNKIHQLTLRGGANFLVCSPSVATILESIPGYAADTDGDKMQFAMGVQKVGAINNRFYSLSQYVTMVCLQFFSFTVTGSPDVFKTWLDPAIFKTWF
jgi:hypothetical protein